MVFAGVRTAVVHEWLLDYGGSERVLREVLELLPDADLFALVDRPDAELRQAIPRRAKATTFIQSLPNPRRWLAYYIPMMPLAIEQLDLAEYDVVVSCSHTVAKGVITGPDQLHASYVNSPPRYAWDMRHQYLRQSGLGAGLTGLPARWALHRMRLWDAATAGGPDVIACNSRFVARRIRKAWSREAQVIYPPVDVSGFAPGSAKEDFCLTVSRLQPYKRVDVLVEAFREMPEQRLVVIGDGPELGRIRARAPANVSLLGYRSSAEVRDHMERAKVFLFAGVEDFGIVMVEAQASGTPVIALGRGAAPEIVLGEGVERPTGILFREQAPHAVADAVRRFELERHRFTPQACRENAMRFDRSGFQREFGAFLTAAWERFSAELTRT